MINIAKKGGGIALLMEKPATNLISDTLCIVPIRPEVTTQIYLAYSPHHQITSEMMDFLDAASAMVSRNTNHK